MDSDKSKNSQNGIRNNGSKSSQIERLREAMDKGDMQSAVDIYFENKQIFEGINEKDNPILEIVKALGETILENKGPPKGRINASGILSSILEDEARVETVRKSKDFFSDKINEIVENRIRASERTQKHFSRKYDEADARKQKFEKSKSPENDQGFEM